MKLEWKSTGTVEFSSWCSRAEARAEAKYLRAGYLHVSKSYLGTTNSETSLNITINLTSN